MLRELIRRLGHVGRRSAFEREIDEELRFHIEARTADLRESGLNAAEADVQARREFGPRARSLEDTRHAWQFRWIGDAFADLRYALRSFRRNRAFAATAIACLAIGIGANALIFSLVNAVLVRSLPYPDADRIAMVRFTPPSQADQKLGSNSGSYFFIREHSQSFEKMGAVRVTGIGVTGAAADGERIWVQIGWVSPGLTDVLGVQPLLGRWFQKDDTTSGVVISYGLWQRLYGGRSDILGQNLNVDARSPTIVGVMPRGYQTLNPDIDLWALQPDENLANALRSPNRVFNIFGRLKPGVSIEQAQAEMNTLAEPLGVEMDMNRGWGIAVDSLRDAYVGYLRWPLLILQGAVLFLLLIACSNVAALLLAQSSARQKELALRSALGSSRGRIVRQLLTENVLLSLLGGGLGIGLAWASLTWVIRRNLAANPHLQGVGLDWSVLAFTLLISVATGLIFGVLPAVQISRPALAEVIRETGRSLTASAARSRLRGAFVVAQVALALVLLVGSGLLIRTLVRLNATDPGLDPGNLMTLQIPFPRGMYRGVPGVQNTTQGGLVVEFDSRFAQLSERVRDRLKQVPGVEAVTASTPPPLGGDPRRMRFTLRGQAANTQEREAWSAEWYPVSPEFFETLKIPVKRGRGIDAHDQESAPPVAVISETLARRYFPDRDPIGQTIQMDVVDDPPREIVGIVGDVRQDRFQSGAQPQMYMPRVQLPHRMDMTLSLDVLVVTYVVRTTGDPSALVPALRTAIADVDRSLPVSSVRAVEEYAAGQLHELNQYAVLLSLFGGISLLLAVTGIVGVMVHTVSQRTNEIGIRLALGASGGSVLGIILRQGFVLIAVGLAVGIGLSLVVMPLIRSFLWDVSATDPLTFAMAAAGLACVALLACYLPARRALRVDPVIALRAE